MVAPVPGQTADVELLVILASTLLSGLVVGGLGRFALHGPDPMTLPQTIAVGVVGAVLGGVIGALIWGPDEPGFTLPIQVACATAIVYAVRQRRRRAAERTNVR